MSAPIPPDVSLAAARAGACPSCGRPVLLDETGEQEVRTCLCHWRGTVAGPGQGTAKAPWPVPPPGRWWGLAL